MSAPALAFDSRQGARIACRRWTSPLGRSITASRRPGRRAIEYEPRVERLCRRHPEMGPCQYERDQCRAKGGRVFTARNEEVTVAVEAEYDRIVRRVRFQGDCGKK